MIIHLGLAIQDGTVLPAPSQLTLGEIYRGPRRLLTWLEDRLGLRQPEDNVEHLRIEQYRQALKYHLATQPETFYAASYAADDLGTAAALLDRRDELLAAGCDLAGGAFAGERLRTLAAIERLLRDPATALRLLSGRADRGEAVLAAAARIPAFLTELRLCDERALFPPFWQRFFSAVAAAGVAVVDPGDDPAADPTTDLGHWRAFLRGEVREPTPPRGDGTLLLLRGFRETHLAAYLARLLRDNPSYRPSLLLPRANRTLDGALTLEGLPSLGVPAASLARPSLQVLKLAPVFLWQPVDLYKIMEFVSLAVKPLEEHLGRRIANFLAETPGLFSARWYGMINDYFERELPQRLGDGGARRIAAIRDEYQFWFNRQRADSRTETVAKEDVIAIYRHLRQWAVELGKNDGGAPLPALAAQAKRIVELLTAQPEERLGYLELERIVRTIYEPAPLRYQAAEVDHRPPAHHPGAVIGPVKELIWWDFFEREPDYFFSRWYPEERRELTEAGVRLEDPERQNTRLVTQRRRPLKWATDRVMLCQPDYSEGDPVTPHPLLGDLAAAFGEDHLHRITLHVDKGTVADAWRKGFRLPDFTELPPRPLERPVPFLEIARPLLGRETETPTSLEQLLYHPHQWVFRHHIKLRQSNILSVVRDARLLGNLAHRLLEALLEEDFSSWSKSRVENWVEKAVPELLKKEGATLLLYGREPERIAFTKQMKYAAWSLIHLLKENDWEVAGTEAELEGTVDDIPLKGRADLVLRRGAETAVVDLKWRGKTRYANLLSSGEDLQLALYAKLLPPAERWAHTAYFIIERGQLLVRNTQAFQGVQPVQDEVDHADVYTALLDKVVATYRWRLEQLRQGRLEIRCAATQMELEDTYGDVLLDLLEMKTTDAFFDDYDALIGLLQ